MKLTLIFTGMLSVLLSWQVQAQDQPVAPAYGWTGGGSIGLDLSGIGIINPRVGSGANRFGLGGLVNLFANKKEARTYWENNGTLQLSLQRLGRTKATDARGFQKNLDLLRLTSRTGWKLQNDKLFIAVEGMGQSLLLKTYASNYVVAQDAEDKVIARFFSPVELRLSPGLDYRPDTTLSIFYSPVSLRVIYVADDSIAALDIHGNDSGKNNSFQVGSNLVIKYTGKFWQGHIAVGSVLSLYSNYLETPQNVDVLWTNNIALNLFKGFSLNLLGELNYDDDVAIIRDRNGDDFYDIELDGTSKGPQFTGAFLLKYSKTF